MVRINDKKKKIWLTITAVIIGAFIGHVITLQEYQCSGIGGFVYQETKWAQQTYNIVSDCRNLDGMNIPVLYYNDDRRQFYCIKKSDCTEDGCRYKEIYFNPIIQK